MEDERFGRLKWIFLRVRNVEWRKVKTKFQHGLRAEEGEVRVWLKENKLCRVLAIIFVLTPVHR